MKLHILIGIVIAAVLVGAGFLAPQFRSSELKQAEAALEQAMLAQRQLYRYSPSLSRIENLVQPDDLKQALDQNVLDRARDQLQDLQQSYSSEAGQSQRRAQEHGLQTEDVNVVRPDAGALRRAVDAFQSATRQNQQLFTDAAKNAREAGRNGGDTVGVPRVEGMVEYTRAADLLAKAHHLRGRQLRLQDQAVETARQQAIARSFMQQYANMDVTDIVAQLEQDLEDLQRMAFEAGESATNLDDRVRERAQRLADVRAEMNEVRNSLFALEERGFVAGNDQSFSTYRRSFNALNNNLRDLAEQEHALQYGMQRGAEFVGEDLSVAEMRGGQPFLGLQELQRRLDIAQDRSRRLRNAVETIQKHIEFVRNAGRDSEQAESRYADQLDALEASLGNAVEEVVTLAGQAAEKEDAAVKAAQAAERAFGKSQRAIAAWVSEAERVRREKDVDRLNPRLKIITEDPYVEQIGKSAQAAAHMLIARTQVQRFLASQRLANDMATVDDMSPDFVFDVQPYQQTASAARDEGIKALTAAQGIYEQLQSGPAATKWVPQSLLAVTHHLMAVLDAQQTQSHLDNALAAINAAVGERAQSPYLDVQVAFRDYLQKRIAGPAKTGDTSDEDEVWGSEDENIFQEDADAGEEEFFEEEPDGGEG